MALQPHFCSEYLLRTSQVLWCATPCSGKGRPNQQAKTASDAASARTQHTLFERPFSCTDERDFIGINHVMRSILQDKPEPREFVTRQRALLAGIQKPLLMNEHHFWSEWISLADTLPKAPKHFSIQKLNIFMYAIFHAS